MRPSVPQCPDSSAQAHGSSLHRGFTLIELMVILTLIALLSAFILPEMAGTYQDSLLRAASRRLMDVFDLASSQAIALQTPQHVQFDLKAHHCSIEAPKSDRRDSGSKTEGKGLAAVDGQWDSRIQVRLEDPPSEAAPDTGPVPTRANPRDETPTPETSRKNENPSHRLRITFYPDGTADGKRVILEDPDGFQHILDIQSATARVQLKKSKSKRV